MLKLMTFRMISAHDLLDYFMKVWLLSFRILEGPDTEYWSFLDASKNHTLNGLSKQEPKNGYLEPVGMAASTLVAGRDPRACPRE